MPNPNDEYEEAGDVSSFRAPSVTVERFLADIDPRYGEHVATKFEQWAKDMGVASGKALLVQVEALGRRVSDKDGDRLMAKIKYELENQLPPDVDKSDLEEWKAENDGDSSEFFEDAFYDGSGDLMHTYLDAMMPYLKGIVIKLARGLEYGMPFPIVDEFYETGFIDPPVDPQ